MNEIYHLLLGALVVWRVTSLIHAEDGPWGLLRRWRHLLRRLGAGELVDCFYCLSLWIAAPVAWSLGSALDQQLLLWPALSGAAILLERITGRVEVPPAPYVEGEENDELLRTRIEEFQRVDS